jgi:uncharacterized protein YaiI (UPF0178 family)
VHIWIDADALPHAIKDIIIRAAERLNIRTTFVANQPMRLKQSPNIHFMLVQSGLDVADEEIVKLVQKDDLVITADIPLAAQIVDKDALVLSPRGELMTNNNVKELLSVRNFMHDLRNAGVDTGGPSTFSSKDKQNFANTFHKILMQNMADKQSRKTGEHLPTDRE